MAVSCIPVNQMQVAQVKCFLSADNACQHVSHLQTAAAATFLAEAVAGKGLIEKCSLQLRDVIGWDLFEVLCTMDNVRKFLSYF